MSIFDGASIEAAKVDVEALAAVFLPHHNYGGGQGAVRGHYNPHLQHLLQLLGFLGSDYGVLAAVGEA